MKNIYLTKAQELNLKYAGLDLGDETEKKLEIIMEDNHTKKEAVDWGVVECDGVTYFIDYVA